MKNLGTVLLAILIVIVLAASILASYYGATSHSDNAACHNGKFELKAISTLATSAAALVQNDPNISDHSKQDFLIQFTHVNQEVKSRLANANC